jgi:hypothetical protein
LAHASLGPELLDTKTDLPSDVWLCHRHHPLWVTYHTGVT